MDITCRRFGVSFLLTTALVIGACGSPATYDVVLRGGTIYDGSGGDPYVGDVAILDDTIAAVGNIGDANAAVEVDVTGLAVAPGFVNMMSWANESLIEDGLSQSNIRQGVTLEVMGEGESMGPLSDAMKAELFEGQSDIKYVVDWTTLDEYLEFLESRGVSPNVASFIGTGTPRAFVIGHEDRVATKDEMEAMRTLVRDAMEDGALGVASSLIYPPGSFASTEELIELSKVAAEYDGLYASHMRDEGANMLEAIEELITIAREANIRAEIYHLKSSGRGNWHLFDDAITMVEKARDEGLQITADVYTYPAGSTGLNAAIPPWVQEGGFEASVARMQDPAVRDQIAAEMLVESNEWENMYMGAGTPDNILLVGFRNDDLKPLTGKTLADVAEKRGTDPALHGNGPDSSKTTAALEQCISRNLTMSYVRPCRYLGSASILTKRRLRRRVCFSRATLIRARTAVLPGFSPNTCATRR